MQQEGQTELYINNEWTKCHGNSCFAEAILWLENGNHASICTTGGTAEEADRTLTPWWSGSEMGFRAKLKRLERLADEDMIRIPQQDGKEAKFPRSAYKDAFLCAMDRLKGGPEVPARHSLLEAARNSSDPRWRGSYFSDIDYVGVVKPVEDLSEP